MGLDWGRQDPGGPHVGTMNLAIRDNLGGWCKNMVNTYDYEDVLRNNYSSFITSSCSKPFDREIVQAEKVIVYCISHVYVRFSVLLSIIVSPQNVSLATGSLINSCSSSIYSVRWKIIFLGTFFRSYCISPTKKVPLYASLAKHIPQSRPYNSYHPIRVVEQLCIMANSRNRVIVIASTS